MSDTFRLVCGPFLMAGIVAAPFVVGFALVCAVLAVRDWCDNRRGGYQPTRRDIAPGDVQRPAGTAVRRAD